MSAYVWSNTPPPSQLSIFQPYSHRCIKGIGGVQPGARCIWTSSHRCLGRPDFFFWQPGPCANGCKYNIWFRVWTGAKYDPVKVGGIAVCAETFQGSVGGRRACLPLIQLFFCFCSVQTNTYRGIEGGNWLSSLGGEGVYLVRAVPESRACGGWSFEASRSPRCSWVLSSFF